MYESEEQQGQGRLMDVQKELAMLQTKLSRVEASRASLEASLKEETSARSQLVSQLFALRKVNAMQ
jgi:septal ring factor EnvC (AmiA/AmiB activator)